MTSTNYASPDTRTLRQRILANLFPVTTMPIPEDDLPGFAPSYLKVTTEAHLDWRDRLRILISGKCRVDVRIHTDVTVSRSQSEAAFSVLQP